ncbi:MAG: tRNA (adenosine(37)-N6)-threonylcarbamoyltransferase complex dimerization subunit type 1 TsaB [Pseudomonadota bacterium]
MLALDTCLSALTLALETSEGRAVSFSEEIGVGHAEKVAPACAKLFEEAGIEAADLTRIGVTVGPGSFMGQRVGIAFAKGLAMGSGAATVPMTTLEAIAEGAGEAAQALIDARRGQVYAQRFTADGEPETEPSLISYEEGLTLLDDGRLALGSGVQAVDPGRAAPTIIAARPEALLAITKTRAAAPLKTLYLRAPDAKPPSKAPL